MNMDRLINMVIRQVIRQAVNLGVKAGMKKVASGARDRQQMPQDKNATRQVRQSAKMMRRMTRL